MYHGKKMLAVMCLYEFVEIYTSHLCVSIRNSYLNRFEKLCLGNYGIIVYDQMLYASMMKLSKTENCQ